MRLAVVMVAVLLASIAVPHAGERAEKAGRTGSARAMVGLTVLLGVAFLVLQTIEYRNHFKTLLPTENAYSSIFYTMTSIHGAHLLLGLLMLVYVLALPVIGSGTRPPHRALHNASLYWHFVDAVWLLIVALLYVAPNVK
jgi:heme/copper-type cytochrome/quinol oxidase subunit 3